MVAFLVGTQHRANLPGRVRLLAPIQVSCEASWGTRIARIANDAFNIQHGQRHDGTAPLLRLPKATAISSYKFIARLIETANSLRHME
jgi:hypothetical protein